MRRSSCPVSHSRWNSSSSSRICGIWVYAVTGRSRTCSFSGRVKLKATHSIPAVCALRQDIDQFWRDEARAHEDNCFSKDAPQVALGVYRRDECVFAQLGGGRGALGATPRWNAVSNLIRGTRIRWKNCGPPAAGRDRLQGSGLPRLAAERGGVRRARTSAWLAAGVGTDAAPG